LAKIRKMNSSLLDSSIFDAQLWILQIAMRKYRALFVSKMFYFMVPFILALYSVSYLVRWNTLAQDKSTLVQVYELFTIFAIFYALALSVYCIQELRKIWLKCKNIYCAIEPFDPVFVHKYCFTP